MTDDEFNRKIEFLLEWQARFSADMEASKERHARFEAEAERQKVRQDRFEAHLEAVTAVANSAIDTSTKVAEVVTMLVEAQGVLNAATRRKFAETKQQIRETRREVARVAHQLEAHMREYHTPGASPG
jgi:hypothetical protein